MTRLKNKLRGFFIKEKIYVKAYTNDHFWRPVLIGRKPLFRQVALNNAQFMASGWVLDVGTGFGHLPLEIERICPNASIVCLDIEEQLFKDTMEKIGSKSEVAFIKASVEHLPFKNNIFTSINSLFSLHLWKNKQQGIKEMCRVLVPGGKVFIMVGRSYLIHGMQHITDYFTKLSLKDLNNMFLTAGFTNVEIRIEFYDRISITAIKEK